MLAAPMSSLRRPPEPLAGASSCVTSISGLSSMPHLHAHELRQVSLIGGAACELRRIVHCAREVATIDEG